MVHRGKGGKEEQEIEGVKRKKRWIGEKSGVRIGVGW